MNSSFPSSTIIGRASLCFSRNIPNMYWWKAGDYLRLSVNARQDKHFFRIGLMTPKQSHCASNIHFWTNLSNEHDHFWYFGPMLNLLLLVIPFKSSYYHNIQRIKGDIMTTTVSQLVLEHFRMANQQTAPIFVVFFTCRSMPEVSLKTSSVYRCHFLLTVFGPNTFTESRYKFPHTSGLVAETGFRRKNLNLAMNL